MMAKTEVKIDLDRLKVAMREANINQKLLTYLLDINRTTLWRKLRQGASAFSVTEYFILRDALGITSEELEKIFRVNEGGV